MTTFQRLISGLLPAKWARSMEEESRRWVFQCSCGRESSVWESGGIRWKARGEPRRYLRCPRCGQRGWRRLSQLDSRNE